MNFPKIKPKHLLVLWIPFLLILVFVVIPSVNNTSSQECHELKQEIDNLEFKGVILDKPACVHCSQFRVLTSTDTITIRPPYVELYYAIKKGDSISKSKSDIGVNVFHIDSSKWIRYEGLKYIPSECE